MKLILKWRWDIRKVRAKGRGEVGTQGREALFYSERTEKRGFKGKGVLENNLEESGRLYQVDKEERVAYQRENVKKGRIHTA